MLKAENMRGRLSPSVKAVFTVRSNVKNTEIVVENRSISTDNASSGKPLNREGRGVPAAMFRTASITASELGMVSVKTASADSEPEGSCRLRKVVDTAYEVVSRAIRKQTEIMRQ